jgi:hypothetical protein
MSAKQVIIAAVAISGLTLALASGVSLISAMRTGAKLESDITAAQATLAKHEEILRENLAVAIGVEALSLIDAKRAAGTALRSDAEAGRRAVARLKQRYTEVSSGPASAGSPVRTVSPEVVSAVTNAARLYVEKSGIYEAKVAQAKGTYILELDSGWSGMWLRMAGYPTIRLNPTKTRISLPAIETTPKVPVPEVSAALPAASLPAPAPAALPGEAALPSVSR